MGRPFALSCALALLSGRALAAGQLAAEACPARKPDDDCREVAATEAASGAGPGLHLVQRAAVAAARARRGAAARLKDDPVAVIPGTSAPMVKNREDYTRGRTPWRLFDGEAPGERTAEFSEGLPPFDPSDRAHSQEQYVSIPPDDPVGVRCVPGHVPRGMVFYNVWVPELLPFLVDPTRKDFQNVSVIIAPGGGWKHVAWEAEGLTHAEWLNSLGISAFVLKYRVPALMGAISEADAQRAILLVRSRAKEHGLDPHRVGFMGSSAGGLMAVSIATSPQLRYAPIDDLDTSASPRPDFTIVLYSTVTFTWLLPATVTSLPPTFLAYTLNDPCIPHALNTRFKDLVNSSKHLQKTMQVVEYAEGEHAWGDCSFYPEEHDLPVCHWRDPAEKFIREKVL